MSNLREDLHKLKRPSLRFELLKNNDEEEKPHLDTYFGGQPYITDIKELQVCPSCGNHMAFVFQTIIPSKTTLDKNMYSFYYCFECAYDLDESAFALNIYKNPSEEGMLTEFEYFSEVPRANVQYNPVYELPEWDYLDEFHPEIADELSKTYGEHAIEAYVQIQNRIKEYVKDTGFKFMGYPETIPMEDIPLCPYTGKKMEPFLQMESVPELSLNWVGYDSYMILFKSPDYEEFALRCLDNEVDYYDDNLDMSIEYKDDEDDDIL